MSALKSDAVGALQQLLAERERTSRKLENLNRQLAAFPLKGSKPLPAKFEFYERVFILKDAPEVFGKTGSILGRAQADDGTWLYAVFVAGPNETWDIAQSDLESQGIIDKREDFYSGQAMKVRVSKSGRGTKAKPSRKTASKSRRG